MKTEPSNLSNMVIAIGKRKGESGSPALSLQDVFSDPANLEGMQQKTLARPKPDRRKGRNLKEKTVIKQREIRREVGGDFSKDRNEL